MAAIEPACHLMFQFSNLILNIRRWYNRYEIEGFQLVIFTDVTLNLFQGLSESK